jgi:hypothetical protein
VLCLSHPCTAEENVYCELLCYPSPGLLPADKVKTWLAMAVSSDRVRELFVSFPPMSAGLLWSLDPFTRFLSSSKVCVGVDAAIVTDLPQNLCKLHIEQSNVSYDVLDRLLRAAATAPGLEESAQ